MRLKITICLCIIIASSSTRAAEKPEVWREAHSPNFKVVTNGNEKQARRVVGRFEQIRQVFKVAFPNLKVDTSSPILILAAKDGKTFDALSPEVWKKRGQLRRGGFFLRGPEKNFVLLRLDVETDELYHAVFHEYTHLLMHQSISSLPLWIDEGLAEFYANTRILDKEVNLGYPSADHVRHLRENRMIPLTTLFSVDHSSPYYNEENKGSVFYAQSWVLVHYLMMEGSKQGKNPLAAYLSLLDQGLEPAAAGTRAFGNLAKLEEALLAYVGAAGYHMLRVKTEIEDEDKSLPVGEVARAESTALRGDFLAHLGERSPARALLAEALALDPSSALACEGLGFIELHERNLAEARKWFEKAVAMDSKSYLANYYHAVLTETEGQDKQHLEAAEASLRRATEMNPRFAPAYGSLASVMGRLGKDLPAALAIARRAVQLEPGFQGFQLVEANLHMQMGQVAEGRAIAERLVTSAKKPEDRANAEMLLARIKEYQEQFDRHKEAEERAKVEAQRFREDLQDADRRRLERGEEEKRAEAEAAALVAKKFEGLPSGKYTAGWSAGKVAAVSCKESPGLEMTLQSPLNKLRLHTANYFKMEFTRTTWTPPDPFDPCKHLLGHTVAISYRKYENSPYDGEIVSVEVRK
jgi:tetratricopeptide (TPR) repeat protein